MRQEEDQDENGGMGVWIFTDRDVKIILGISVVFFVLSLSDGVPVALGAFTGSVILLSILAALVKVVMQALGRGIKGIGNAGK